ncbi:MAG: hypothetical protein AAGB00_06510 [Planctomycetota bacterium]
MFFDGHPRVTARRRAGASVIQLLACVVAIGGGVWLGAEYMGVKLSDLAYTALDETAMLDKVPESWRPELSECPIGECPEKTAPDEHTAELRSELESLRLEAAKLRKSAETGERPELITASAGERALQRDLTLAYWARLCEVANQVADVDGDVEPAMNRSTTGHVFDLRRRAYRYGQKSLESIDDEGVDADAINAGNRLISWYGDGARFYTEATAVWDGLAGAEQNPVAEAALDKQRLQYRKQTELLRVKLAELSSLLSRRYAVAFPKIGV